MVPEIPFGYRRVIGQSQKGDGIWDGKKFVRVKKQYPHTAPECPVMIIRRCVVTQPELPINDGNS